MINFKIKKFFASILVLTFVFQQCSITSALAVNIQGNGVTNVTAGNSYNIEKQFSSGTTDFRNYNEFNLTKAQIANLIFSSGSNKFVNLMKGNAFQINGIVNSMKGGTFFGDGHVIFVSPKGTVIGSSGVLNVGALSIFTPSVGQFDNFVSFYAQADNTALQPVIDTKLGELRADSQGKVEMYGKVFSRGEVDINGSEVLIGNGTDRAGIFAGVQTNGALAYTNGITTEGQATTLFDALVNNKIAQGAGFGLNDGKLIVNARALGDKTTDGTPVVASVDINNAILGAKEIEIKAESKADFQSTQTEINTKGAPVSYALNLLDPLNSDYYDKLGNIITSLDDTGKIPDELYYGPIAKATVNITNNSDLVATEGNINISTKAEANLAVPKLLVEVTPDVERFFYAYRTDTTSQVNVKNSTLKAKGDVDVLATSNNQMDIKIAQKDPVSGDKSSTRIMLLASKANAKTEAIIDSGSTINAKNLNMNAVNATSQNISASADVKFVENASEAVALVGVINEGNIDTKVSFGGEVEQTDGDVTLNAQNLYLSSIKASTSASGKAEANQGQDQNKSKKDGIIDKLTGFFNKKDAKNANAQGAQKENLMVAGGGAVIYNNGNVNTTAQVENTAEINANNLTINANTVDLTTNSATSKTTAAKLAAGAAVVINDQDDNTTAQIVKGNTGEFANINLNGDLKVNATNNMPLNTTTLEIILAGWDALKTPFTGEFWSEIGAGDFNYIKDYGTGVVGVVTGLKRTGGVGLLGIPGFFNNYAQSTGGGETVGLAGSVIYSDVTTTTKAYIGDYTNITKARDVIVNAANEIVYANCAGVIEAIYKPFDAVSGEVGVGGSVVLAYNNHNALAQMGDNVKVGSSVANSVRNLKMNAATDQTNINVAIGGGKAEKMALIGSVAIVNVDGATEVSIGKSTIFTESLNLNAGSATSGHATSEEDFFGSELYVINGLGADGFVSLADKAISDTTRFFTIAGALAKQSEQQQGGGGGGGSSSGVAIGASVGVNILDRTVDALIKDGANITYKKDVDLNASTDTFGVNVALAGAFAGGVTADKSKNNTGAGSNGEKQKTSNQGGWMDKVSGILTKLKGTTESNNTKNATAKGTQNAANDNNTKNALGETGKDKASGEAKNENSIGDKLAGTNNLTGDGNQNTQASDATSNISVAAAGSVNATIMGNEVSATVGNATITKSGTDAGSMDITASQDTLLIDVAGGLGKAGTVGAGAALNLNMSDNETVAGSVGTLKLNGSDLNITAREDLMAVDVAVGVGVADDQDANFQLAIGGSFNATVIGRENTEDNPYLGVKSYLGGKVEKAGDITVDATNKSQLIKVAGAASVTSGGSSSTSAGMGLAGNLNVLSKITTAEILSGADIESTGDVIVATNRKIKADGSPLTKPTGALDLGNAFKYADDMIISAAAAASISKSGSTTLSLTGALGVDIMNNISQALIGSGAEVTASSIKVEANEYVSNNNVAGAIGISTGESSYGVGIGAVVEVIDNTTEAKIDGAAKIKTTGVLDVVADYDEMMNFLAINGGGSKGNGFVASVNGIVHVLLSSVNAEILNSQDVKTGNLNVLSNYDSTIEGATLTATINTGQGFCASANIIANVLDNEVSAKITDSDIVSTGKITLSAISTEHIYVLPVAVAVAKGSSAIAANIAATVLLNETTALISGTTTKISANGDVDVIAKDDTTQINRGGTIAVGGKGVGIGGTIIVDVYSKDVEASIDDGVKITKAGNVKVEAEAKNYFGPKTTIEIGGMNGLSKNTGASDLKTLGSEDDLKKDVGDASTLANWEMIFDIAGGDQAAVSGSLITKVINNDVTARVGKGVEITSSSLDVSALNDTAIRAIVGNVTGSGSVAVGASLFVNVVTGTTKAIVDNNAIITTTGRVGVKSETIEDVRTIMAIGGGAGKVAVNGSANVNVFVNNTNAIVGENVTINANSLDVKAKEEIDIQSINIAINGAGNAAIGVIAYVNTISNKVKALISKSSDIKTTNKTTLKAESNEAFGGIFLIGNGSGNVTVGGLAIVNVINSTVSAFIEETTIEAGSVDVIAIHDYNKLKYTSDVLPIVTAINIGVSGTASIAATVVTNVITADSSATVDGSTISTNSGLTISAISNEKIFDAVAAITGAGAAAVNGTAIVNVTDGDITAELLNSTVNKGAVNINANEDISMQEAMASVAVSGTAAVAANAVVNILQSRTQAYSKDTTYNIGAAGIAINAGVTQNLLDISALLTGGTVGVSASAVVNTINNTLSAYMTGKSILNAGDINVTATQETIISANSAGASIGTAAVGASGVVNVLSTKTSAYIEDVAIANAKDITVNATSTETLDGVNVNAALAVGFAGGVSALVNVIENETAAYINAKTKNVKANSITITSNDTIEITDIVGAAGLDASFSGAAIALAAGVSVINNSVKSELLSTTGIYTITNGVNVTAESDITLTPLVVSAAAGGVGFSGSVAVASIGGKYKNNNNTDYNSDGSVDKAQTQADNDKHSITANGKSYSTADVELNSGENKGGTVARIDAKEVKAKNITVEANNTTNLDSKAATLAAGLYGGMGANVLVTDMKYGTTAKIENTKINASEDIKVAANSDIVADSAAGAVSVGGFAGISATVAYFENSAITTAIISNNTNILNARNVSVLANSNDDIDSKVLSVGAGLVAASVVIGLSETNNKTYATIEDSAIVNTGNTDVIASTTSKLSSDVATAAGGGVAVNVVVNRSASNALTEAVIKGTSNIISGGNLRLISSTGGISSAITLYMGSISMVGVGVDVSMADVSATFNTKISDTSSVEANNVDLKAGVDSEVGVQNPTYTTKGKLTSEVKANKASAGIVDVAVSYQRASVNGNTNIATDAGTKLKARNNLNVLSALSRVAKTGQNSVDIGGLTLGVLTFNSTVNGDSAIDLKNTSAEAKSINIKMDDERLANTKLNMYSVSAIDVEATTVKATVGGNSNINTSGLKSTGGITINSTGNSTSNVETLSASLSLVGGSGLDVNSNVLTNSSTAIANSQADGTISITNSATKNTNISSKSESIGILSLDFLDLTSVVSGANTITVQDCVANAIAANLNDTSNANVSMVNAEIKLLDASINDLKAGVDVNTTVDLKGVIKANTTTVTTDVKRAAKATAEQNGGSLVGIDVLNVDAITKGESKVGISANMSDANYKNELTVNSIATNEVKTFTGGLKAALVAISKGRIKNTMDTTNKVALEGANIDSKGNIFLKADNKNNMEMSKESSSYGGILINSDSIKNSIDSKSYVNINNSKINAENFTAEAKTKLSSINPLKISDDSYGFTVSGKAELSTELQQSNEINISGGSKINAKNNVTLEMDADTDFAQHTISEAGGLSASPKVKSLLTVTNNNTLNIKDANTEVHAGENVKVLLDSTNSLESKASADARHLGGNPGVESRVNLTVNNKINVGDAAQSNSLMSADNLVKIDFMKSSTNNITQDAYLYAEAAVATGAWDGGIGYTTNNQLDVKKGAKILSLKDVLINYSNGANYLTSRVAYKKVSRILFGIPITSSGSSSKITTNYTNDLTLNGVIEAGAGNERTLVIDKDGNVVTSEVKGFKNTDYIVIDTDISGTNLDSGTITIIEKEITYLRNRILELEQSDSNNKAEIARYNAEITNLNSIINTLNTTSTIYAADARPTIFTAVNNAARSSAVDNGVRSQDLDAMTSVIQNGTRNSLLTYLNAYHYQTGSGENVKTVWLTYGQINNILAAFDSAFNGQVTTLAVGKDSVAIFQGKIIIEDANDTTVSTLLAQANATKTNLEDVINSMTSDFTDAINKLKDEIANLEAYKTSLSSTLLTGDEAGTGGTVLFKDINATPAKIEITGLKSLQGNGEFFIHGTGLSIDNYSNRSLVFGNINFANVANAGLTINNVSYNHYANTGNGIIFGFFPTGVTFRKTNDTGININNWHDHNNPLLPLPAHLAKITVAGNIFNTSGLVDIFNDSGNITLNGSLVASEKRIAAAQGDVVMKKIGTLALAANDYIIAGRNVLITGNVTNDGLIQAGVPDRKLVIDDAMYASKLELDANGVSKMDTTRKSVYLNDTNNVKAIKDSNGDIQLYNTIVDGGTVNISGSATNGTTGSIKASTVSGYGSIDVQNNTNNTLVVNNVTNNHITVNNKATGATIVPRNLLTGAATKITSKANLIAKGIISSGNKGATDTGAGTLELISQEGSVTVNDNPTETIDTTGTAGITAKNGVVVKGKIKNRKGATTITNTHTNGILIESTGRITNDNGKVTLSNDAQGGSGDMTIKGLILAKIGDIKLKSNDSNIIIGDKTSNDNYVRTNAANSVVEVETNNGSLLNANRNESTAIINGNPLNSNANALDKTLIKAAGDLKMALVDGDIGSYDQNKGNGARDNKPAGFTMHGTTRDYTETVNVNVAGNITASAKNNANSSKRLINLRSKQSDMNIGKIEAEGNVMLTAADWKQKDDPSANAFAKPNPLPSNGYFEGYSILNAKGSSESIVGDNISLIASNNLGSEISRLTYKNTNNGWLSAEAENDIFLKGARGFDSNIWQLISKRGDIDFVLNGDAVIKEIAAGRHIYIQSLGANLTILSLGIPDGAWGFDDDLLYPHDLIKLGANGGGIPETAAIEVLDAFGGDIAHSTLNIYSGYLKGAKDNKPRKGQDDTKSDVTLMADTIIATSATAPNSDVSTNMYPNGYINSTRHYAIDPITANIDFNPNVNGANTVAAEGFATYGKGPQLSFSISGVDPNVVQVADKTATRTNFKDFIPIKTIKFFENKLQVKGTKSYKTDEVRLSLNSNRVNDNRGMLLNRLYADNAYVDTMDLNMAIKDAQIINYAEFRNGNRGGTGGYVGPYRWLAVVDNDFRRYIDDVLGKTVTTQYYTQKTGSLSINMGNLIDVLSSAPTVHYNPYEVSNLPQSENSFFRLTYKDDKIQETTTTPEFEEVDKSTYKPTKREGIRFGAQGSTNGTVLVSNTDKDNPDEKENKFARIIKIIDISRGGLKVSYDGDLQVGDTFRMTLASGNISTEVNVKVVRIDDGSQAGLKFIDLDKATANKLIYIQMLMTRDITRNGPQAPQAVKPILSDKLLGAVN